jgi:hypothetical protein
MTERRSTGSADQRSPSGRGRSCLTDSQRRGESAARPAEDGRGTDTADPDPPGLLTRCAACSRCRIPGPSSGAWFHIRRTSWAGPAGPGSSAWTADPGAALLDACWRYGLRGESHDRHSNRHFEDEHDFVRTPDQQIEWMRSTTSDSGAHGLTAGRLRELPACARAAHLALLRPHRHRQEDRRGPRREAFQHAPRGRAAAEVNLPARAVSQFSLLRQAPVAVSVARQAPGCELLTRVRLGGRCAWQIIFAGDQP